RLPQEQDPQLDSFLEGGLVRLLSPEEEAEIQVVLGGDARRRKTKLAARATSAIPPLPASLDDPPSGDGLPPWIVPEAIPVATPAEGSTVDVRALADTAATPAVRPLALVPIPVKDDLVTPVVVPVV